MHVLLPANANNAVSGASSRGQQQMALGERLWSVLKRLLPWAFTAPRAESASELFQTLRHVALVSGKLVDLVEVTIARLSELRQRSLTLKSTAVVATAAAASGTTPAATAAAVSGGSGSGGGTTTVQPQASWLLLSFLDQVLDACEPPAAQSKPGGGRNAANEDYLHCSEADGEPGSERDESLEPRASEMEAMADAGAEMDVVDDSPQPDLSCRVCTFAVTGSNFTEQHWYYCYTCGLTQSEGCCSVCVKVCHKGHVVSYSRRSRFFCDCGAGAAAARAASTAPRSRHAQSRPQRRRAQRRHARPPPPPRRVPCSRAGVLALWRLALRSRRL